MASPILPTPALYGEDARDLIESLKNTASPEEMKERIRLANEALKASPDGWMRLVIEPMND